MNSTTSIALSGMNAARTALNAAAHNVANLGTPGFRRQVVVLTAQAAGGVSAATGRGDADGADLVADVVAQLQAKNAFLANLSVFKTADRLVGALLDTRS